MQLANLTSVYRYRLIADAYSGWFSEAARVLDAGCGNGIVSSRFVKDFRAELTGCDVDDYLSVALPFVRQIDPERLPFPDSSFSLVMFNDVLHHVERSHQPSLVREALRIGEAALIFELVPTRVGKFFDWLLNKIHHSAMSIPFTFRTPAEWESCFRELGFVFERRAVRRPWFYPFQHVAFRVTKP